MHGCIVAESESIAVACDDGINQCPIPGYPFAPIRDSNWGSDSGILNRTWDYVHFLIENGDVSTTAPMTNAVVLAQSTGSNGEAGIAVFFDAHQSVELEGASVASTVANVPGITIAHEVGHTLGLEHDYSLHPSNGGRGFMWPSGGSQPVLNWEELSGVGALSNGQVWQDLAPGKFVPHPPGFRYVGCEGDDTFCDYAPGLECHDGANLCVEAP